MSSAWVMAGAISGGADTAGVVDFLLEALDAWENAKNSHEAVPAHAVKIRVMTGASAGAMTTALTGLACFSDVTPVRDVKNPPDRKRNRLYDSWVRQVEISCICWKIAISAIRAASSIAPRRDDAPGDRRGGARPRARQGAAVCRRSARRLFHRHESAGGTRTDFRPVRDPTSRRSTACRAMATTWRSN